MIAILLAAATPQVPLGYLPSNAGESMTAYLACLYDDPRFTQFQGKPRQHAARANIVQQIQQDCAATRTQSSEQIEAKLADDPQFVEPAARHTHVLNLLDHIDRQFRFMIVEREKFVKTSHAYEKCLDRGEWDKC